MNMGRGGEGCIASEHEGGPPLYSRGYLSCSLLDLELHDLLEVGQASFGISSHISNIFFLVGAIINYTLSRCGFVAQFSVPQNHLSLTLCALTCPSQSGPRVPSVVRTEQHQRLLPILSSLMLRVPKRLHINDSR